jgi:hypothetical protein
MLHSEIAWGFKQHVWNEEHCHGNVVAVTSKIELGDDVVGWSIIVQSARIAQINLKRSQQLPQRTTGPQRTYSIKIVDEIGYLKESVMVEYKQRSTSCKITTDTDGIPGLWQPNSYFNPELTHMNGRMCMSIFRTIRFSIALSFKSGM